MYINKNKRKNKTYKNDIEIFYKYFENLKIWIYKPKYKYFFIKYLCSKIILKTE